MSIKLIGMTLAFGVAVGVVGTLLFEGNAPGMVATVAVSMILAPVIVIRLSMPDLYRAQVRKIAERGGESPPPGSEPVASPLATAWAGALNAGDFDTAAGLLAEGFVCECPQIGKTFRRAKYLRGLRKTSRYFPQMRYTVHEVHEVHEVREAAGELWVRTTTRMQARRGDPIVTDAWEAWRVDGEQILGMRQGALEVSEAGRA